MSQILAPQGIASFLKMSHNVKNVTKIRKDKTMERYDRNRIHSETMEFVGLIADKVNTIKHDYGLSGVSLPFE